MLHDKTKYQTMHGKEFWDQPRTSTAGGEFCVVMGTIAPKNSKQTQLDQKSELSCSSPLCTDTSFCGLLSDSEWRFYILVLNRLKEGTDLSTLTFFSFENGRCVCCFFLDIKSHFSKLRTTPPLSPSPRQFFPIFLPHSESTGGFCDVRPSPGDRPEPEIQWLN